MNKIYKRYIKLLICILLPLIIITGCNEDEILKEVPVDFASSENAFITFNDFNLALIAMYDQARNVLSADERVILDMHYGTDIGVNNTPNAGNWFGNYPAYLTPQASFVQWHWSRYYKLISSANIIINRLEDSEMTTEQKSLIEANTRFFRGIAYKNLAHLYGGVPIELEEVSSPKTDYTRASRQEVYQQAAIDLEFASQNLKGINEIEDLEASDLAAYHLLAEVYISLARWNDAIQAATTVIDDPNTGLMTGRFGSLSNEPGDVYWDLFRRFNQNRSAGNTEAIMVWQFEVDLLGGIQESSGRTAPLLERNWVPFTGLVAYEDPNGIRPIISPASDDTGGFGIGRVKPTRYFSHGIWQDDWLDMRNSEYNWIRDLTFNNPESEWFGQKLSDHPTWFPRNVNDTARWWYPYPGKITTPGQHPSGLFLDGIRLANSAGTTYTDQYFIRLAETYLLRAEAYLGAGDPINAASDINIVRNRANASNINPGAVNIDFILDERMRELGTEELRRITLMRTGTLYDRVNRYAKPTGFRNNQDIMVDGFGVQPHHNFWPIPFSEIERNTGAALEQNPGY